MIYTLTTLTRGEVVTKEAVRVSTWLRTQGAPEFVPLYNAHVLIFGGVGPIQTMTSSEYFIPLSHILAFHLAPPAKDTIDYDPTEPNRKMEPVTILVGAFRFNGNIRIATAVKLGKVMEIIKETFTSIYDIEISNSGMSTTSSLHVPMALVRLNAVATATRA
jgi:hypothetical protein